MNWVERVREVLSKDWDRAGTLIFASQREFQRWRSGNEGACILAHLLDEKEGVIICFMVRKDEPIIAKVRPVVDDYYIPRDVAESKLDEFNLAVREEKYDFERPALFCRELNGVFYKLVELSARAGAFADMSPEDAKKLLDMAEYVKMAADVLKERVLKGIKGYAALVAFGITKDDRWTVENVEKAFRGEGGDGDR